MADNVYGDAILGWENTLHELKRSGSKDDTDTELDPDAPRRMPHKKSLHEMDKSDQERLVKLLYMCVRSGMLDRAHGLCVEVGQPWRAATLVGWQLEHDPNLFEPASGAEKLPVEGNPKRDLWKKTAWRLSQDRGLPDYERAIYSALCGNAQQLLQSTCSSWESVLWARVKSMVDVLVEKELREANMHRRYLAMPDEYWSNLINMEDVMSSLKSERNVQPELTNPFRIIQTCVILKDWAKLFATLRDLSQMAMEEDPHLLRFICHLAISCADILDSDSDSVQCRNVAVRNYVRFLMRADRVRQIAWYVSLLDKHDQVELYTDFLQTVRDQDDQTLCLKLGLEVDLPMEEIRRNVVDRLLNATQEDAEDDDEAVKINALDWLLYDPADEACALRQANAVARFFIAEKKSSNAKEALLKVGFLYIRTCI